MTRLEANIRDLSAQELPNGCPAWRFRFSKCDSIKETVSELKDSLIGWSYRKEGGSYWWTVEQTKRNWLVLTQLIDNFPILEEALFVAERLGGKNGPASPALWAGARKPAASGVTPAAAHGRGVSGGSR